MVVKVFLDMDPGIDDAAELLAATAVADWEIVGVGTVAGNAGVEQTTRNALAIRDALGLQFRVFRGASRPLAAELSPAPHIHGADGLGGTRLGPTSGSAERLSAPQALIELAESEDLTLIATGPLTNLALAAILRPEAVEGIRRVYVMGGAFGLTPWAKGNVSPQAEYNFWQDPEAANVVFSSFSGVSVVPLDLTMNPSFWIQGSDLEALGRTKRSELLKEIVGFQLRNFGAFVPHDPLAAMVALDESRFGFREGCISVFPSAGWMRGRSFLHEGEGCRRHRVALRGDAAWFKSTFLALIGS